MVDLKRRHFMQAVSLGGAAAAMCPGYVFADAKQSIKITQAVSSLAYAHSYIAQQKGYFEQEGIKADIVTTGGGGPDVQIVLGGRAEFTVSDGAQVLPALQQGQRLTCVSALLNRSIVNVTMRKQVAERLGITEATPITEKIKKLKGLKIGVTKPGALTWQMARYNAFSNGMDPDKDMQIIGMGDAPSLAAAMRNGNIDAIYISVPIGEALVAQGVGITLIDNSKGEDGSLPSFLMEGLWTTPEYIKTNRAIVASTVKAFRRASMFIVTSSPEEIAKVVKPAFSSLADDVLLEGCKKVKQAASPDGVVGPGILDNTQKVLQINGVLKNKFTVAQLFDPSFIG